MIKGINHITLAVSDLSAALDFYCNVLGCNLAHAWKNGAYLEAGSVWICLFVCKIVDIRQDYTHIAFSVDLEGLTILKEKMKKAGVRIWKENQSEGHSIYFLDPDGHKLELHVGNLQSRLNHITGKQVTAI